MRNMLLIQSSLLWIHWGIGIPPQKVLCCLFFSSLKYRPKWSGNTSGFVFVKLKYCSIRPMYYLVWIQIRKYSQFLYKIPKIQIGSPLLLEHLPLCDVEWDFGESLQKILRIAERRRYASLWRVLPRGKDKGNRWGSNVNIHRYLGYSCFHFKVAFNWPRLWKKKLANTYFA